MELDKMNFVKIKEQVMNDWIWDVKWMLEGENLALLLAHNILVIWDWKNNVPLVRVPGRESLLYSACVIGSSISNLVIAAGTVFKQIIIWTLINKEALVMHCLSGHQGAIYCIKYETSSGLLYSSSDDRSVRVWKFSLHQADRETKIDEWINGKFDLVHTLFGHQARVWRVASLGHNGLISIGEDSLICLWKNGTLNRSEKLKVSGIFSVSVNWDFTEAAIGCGNGSLWVLPTAALEITPAPSKLEMECLKLPNLFCPDDDFPRVVKNYQNLILVTTDSGCLLSCFPSTGNWKLIYKSDHLKGYSTMSLSTLNVAAIGTLKGDVILVELVKGVCKKFDAHRNKVQSVIWSDNHLISCGMDGKFILWKLEDQKLSMEAVGFYLLPKCKQHWISTALVIDGAFIIGDRMGGIHLYEINAKKQADEVFEDPIFTLKGFHGKNGVTDLKFHQGVVHTVGRDGRLAVFSLCPSPGGLELLYFVKVPGRNLEWIAEIMWKNENEFYLLGFHSTNFILWDQREQRSLLELSCGGGHRSWDFKYNREMSAFVCVKKNTINYWKCELFEMVGSLVPVKFGLQAKIWAGLFLFGSYVITGGEDNLINVSKVDIDDVDVIKQSATLAGHVSSVRALAACSLSTNDETMKYLMVSAGGQSQIMIWKVWLHVNSENETLGQEKIGYCCLKNHFFSSKVKESLLESRLRCMDVMVRSLTEEFDYQIVLACSDGHMLVFNFNLVISKLECLQEVFVSPSCLLTLNFLEGKGLLLAVGDNAGKLSLLSSTNERYEEGPKYELHSGGVNITTSCFLKDFDTWLVACGGDDNRITVALIRNTKAGIIKVASEALVAHSAQITGLSVHQQSDKCGTIISASVDQRLSFWSWEINREDEIKLRLTHRRTIISSIPDITTLIFLKCSLSGYLAIVIGGGLEVFVITENMLVYS